MDPWYARSGPLSSCKCTVTPDAPHFKCTNGSLGAGMDWSCMSALRRTPVHLGCGLDKYFTAKQGLRGVAHLVTCILGGSAVLRGLSAGFTVQAASGVVQTTAQRPLLSERCLRRQQVRAQSMTAGAQVLCVLVHRTSEMLWQTHRWHNAAQSLFQSYPHLYVRCA